VQHKLLFMHAKTHAGPPGPPSYGGRQRSGRGL